MQDRPTRTSGFSRRDVVFAVLGAFFLTNAITAEMVGGKIIHVAPEGFTIWGARPAATVGVFLWPFVFVTTDLVNEYFGTRGVRRLTLLTVGMIVYVFILLQLARMVPSAGFPNTVDDASFNRVFGQSQWIIVGSLAAFLVSQLVDVFVFQKLRRATGARLLWLRATGSTVISQVLDSVIVLWIGLAIPLGWNVHQFAQVAAPNYLIKLVEALAMTPVIYFMHWLVEKYLGRAQAEELAEQAARSSRSAV
ncbi:MAG: queuosine precursor transporter [Planctomycetota bacterium]